MSSITVLENKLQEAKDVVSKLEQEIREEQKKERIKAIDEAQALIKNHQLNASDLSFSKNQASAKYAKQKGVKLAAKFKDPDTGKLWSGRGRLPGWLTKQIANGKKREDFMIQDTTESKP